MHGAGRPAFRMIYSVDNIILCIILFVNTLLKINNYYWVNCLKSGRAFWLHDKKHRSLRPVFFFECIEGRRALRQIQIFSLLRCVGLCPVELRTMSCGVYSILFTKGVGMREGVLCVMTISTAAWQRVRR